MTKEPPTLAERDELIRLAQSIQTWRVERLDTEQMTWKKLMQKFPMLGSDKNVTAIAKGELEGRRVDNWLPKFRTAWAQIKKLDNKTSQEERLLDLSNVEPSLEAVYIAVDKPGSAIDRLVVIQGTSGAGKSSILARVQAELDGATYLIEADENWKSAREAAKDMLLALGMPEQSIPYRRADRQRELLKRLDRNVVLLIDEAHHGGAEFLSLVKTILNRSQAVVVLAAMDTLWRKLTTDSREEARQLLHNRLSEMVTLYPPTEEDIVLYFEGIMKVPQAAAAKIASLAVKNGYMSYVRKVRKEYLEHYTEGDDPAKILASSMELAIHKMSGTQ